eukprot:140384_1
MAQNVTHISHPVEVNHTSHISTETITKDILVENGCNLLHLQYLVIVVLLLFIIFISIGLMAFYYHKKHQITTSFTWTSYTIYSLFTLHFISSALFLIQLKCENHKYATYTAMLLFIPYSISIVTCIVYILKWRICNQSKSQNIQWLYANDKYLFLLTFLGNVMAAVEMLNSYRAYQLLFYMQISEKDRKTIHMIQSLPILVGCFGLFLFQLFSIFTNNPIFPIIPIIALSFSWAQLFASGWHICEFVIYPIYETIKLLKSEKQLLHLVMTCKSKELTMYNPHSNPSISILWCLLLDIKQHQIHRTFSTPLFSENRKPKLEAFQFFIDIYKPETTLQLLYIEFVISWCKNNRNMPSMLRSIIVKFFDINDKNKLQVMLHYCSDTEVTELLRPSNISETDETKTFLADNISDTSCDHHHDIDFENGDVIDFNSDPEENDANIHTHRGEIVWMKENDIAIKINDSDVVTTYFRDEIQILKTIMQEEPVFIPHYMNMEEIASLKVNDLIDYRDDYGRYLLCKIVFVDRDLSIILLHPIGSVNSKYDRWVQFSIQTERLKLAPPTSVCLRKIKSKTNPFAKVKPGDYICVNPFCNDYSGWRFGKIIKLAKHSAQVKVAYIDDEAGRCCVYWFHLLNHQEVAQLDQKMKNSQALTVFRHKCVIEVLYTVKQLQKKRNNDNDLKIEIELDSQNKVQKSTPTVVDDEDLYEIYEYDDYVTKGQSVMDKRDLEGNIYQSILNNDDSIYDPPNMQHLPSVTLYNGEHHTNSNILSFLLTGKSNIEMFDVDFVAKQEEKESELPLNCTQTNNDEIGEDDDYNVSYKQKRKRRTLLKHVGDCIEFNSEPSSNEEEIHVHSGQIISIRDDEIQIKLKDRKVTYFLDEIDIVS